MVEDGIIELAQQEEGIKYIVKNSRVTKVVVTNTYTYKKLKIEIEQQREGINVGDLVFIDDKSAPDGEYRIGFLRNIYVTDGRVSRDY